MQKLSSFNIYKWVEQNKDLLQPPVGNKNIYPLSEDYIIMVVGGPNNRKDFHYNEHEEFFFQLQGTIFIDIQLDTGIQRIKLEPGDIFLLPPKVPHRPIRPAETVGLVVEQKRKSPNAKDGLLWYCENCNKKLHEVYFTLNDIEQDFLSHFNAFYNNKELRTCKSCQHVLEKVSK